MRVLIVLLHAALFSGLWAQTAVPTELKKEILAFMSAMNQSARTFITEASGVDSPEGMAQTLNRYSDRLQPAVTRMKAVREANRAFFEAAENTPGQGSDDPELDQANKALEETMQGMAPAMARAAQWFAHPAVREALSRLEGLMEGLDTPEGDADEDDED